MTTTDTDEQALRLSPRDLRAQYASADLPSTTAQVQPLDAIAGQERALEAIRLGLELEADGYNVAIAGPPGSGRNSAARLLIDEVAGRKGAAPDWIYVHNFEDAYRPRAVALDPGQGRRLARDLEQFADHVRTELPRAFEGEAVQERSQAQMEPLNARRDELLEALRRAAREHGFTVNLTQQGLLPTPLGPDGQPLSQEQIQQLSEEERRELQHRGEELQGPLRETARALQELDREAKATVADLLRQVARSVVEPLLDELRARYPGDAPRQQFDAIQDDVLERVEVLRHTPESAPQPPNAPPGSDPRDPILHRYGANAFVAAPRAGESSAPVVDERQPTFYNLFGRIDYEAKMGAMTTDYTQIRPGALQRANGGFLILPLPELLQDPRTWLKLKRTLKAKRVRVEDIGEGTAPIPMVALMPEEIPLDVTVVLIGPPPLIALLDAADPDFGELFKVRADFAPDAPVSEEAMRAYAGFVCRTIDEHGMCDFDREALREVLRFGNRLAGRQDRLSTRFRVVGDLCLEAFHLAQSAEPATVTGADVRAAVRARSRRASLAPDRLRDLIAEGTLHIETSGEVVGQVNGLAVYRYGTHAFGTPVRITCRVGAGSVGVVNIERETERSGAIHSKGVLVLSGFLMGTFGRERPLSFSASVTFEQSYDEVDGDSASSAELYAILTSLGRAPIRQDVAVTGSVDQFGAIQPVGGVTEKVEGFFDVCEAVGLTGSQGVIIPRRNQINLNLRDEVVDAVEAGRFHVWAIDRVEEGLEILTGVPAGRADAATFGEGTILQRASEALQAMEPGPLAALQRAIGGDGNR